jgi:hypothetical protein
MSGIDLEKKRLGRTAKQLSDLHLDFEIFIYVSEILKGRIEKGCKSKIP